MSTHNCGDGTTCAMCQHMEVDPVQKAVQEAAARGEDPFLAGIMAKSEPEHCGDEKCLDCTVLVGPSPEQKRLMNHELVDRAYIALDFWTTKIAERAGLSPSLRTKADKITELIAEFYGEAFHVD